LDVDWQVKIFLLIISFFLSAFFSSSEVSLFSLDSKRLKKEVKKESLKLIYIERLLESPKRLLVTILLGNTVANVTASILAVSLAIDFSAHTRLSPSLILTIQIILLTILIVIFGELLPKISATKSPIRIAKLVAIPLYWINVIMFPIAEIFTETIRLSVQKLKFDKSKTAILPDEIEELAELGRERGTIISEEHGLISGIVSLRNVAVREIMTPRVDIFFITEEINFEELLEAIKTSGHSRIPLCKNNIDNITGIVYAKDILPFLKKYNFVKNIPLNKIARKPMFVPETKMINDLMREFQDKKLHIAIVVDEFGGTAGLITLEDIMEEIIGEIRDEYDKDENPISKINDKKIIVLGKLPIDELEKYLNLKLPIQEKEFETVGGFILNHLGYFPKEGYSFKVENINFTIKEITNKRIGKVMIEILSDEELEK
jgi:gliding motility-associated protein GldE